MALSERATFIDTLDRLVKGCGPVSEALFIKLLQQASRHFQDSGGEDLFVYLEKSQGYEQNDFRKFVRGRGFRFNDDGSDAEVSKERRRILKCVGDELYSRLSRLTGDSCR